jgi:hypothetical protein
MIFNQVAAASIRNCRAFEGTEVFLRVMGRESREIRLEANDLQKAKIPCLRDPEVTAGAVKGL